MGRNDERKNGIGVVGVNAFLYKFFVWQTLCGYML